MSHCFYFSILTIKWRFSVIQSFNNLREHPYISISISKYLRVKRTANICLADTFLIEKKWIKFQERQMFGICSSQVPKTR